MSQEFVPMHKVLNEGKTKNFELKKQRVTKQDVKTAKMRTIFNPREIPPKIGTLMVLKRLGGHSFRNGVVMSDAEFEKQTNHQFMRVARGKVLVAGLGIGMILIPLLNDKDVSKITVIEKEKEIIDLVYPKIKKRDKANKLELIHGDATEIEIPKEKKYDVIYFDIWDNVCGDNWEEMKILKKRFRKKHHVQI